MFRTTRIATLLSLMTWITFSAAFAQPGAGAPQGNMETLFRERARQAVEQAPAADVLKARERARRLAEERKATGGEGSTDSMQTGARCFPSCDITDGRFLVIANGDGLATLSDPTLSFEIAVAAGTPSFQIGVFDGDGGAVQADGSAHWDNGATAPFEYTLFADPGADTTGTTAVELLPGVTTVSSTEMPDNDWRDFTVTTGPEAMAPSGHYFYRLTVRLTDLSPVTLNAFKLRTDGVITLEVPQQPFSYIANWTALDDITIVYPDFPETTNTRYDGNFQFYLDLPRAQDEVYIWDGDFDRGKFDGTDLDTDDPNTPNAPFLPPWATVDAHPEGVALGSLGLTSSPPDDGDGRGFGAYLLRGPSVRYDLVFPDGRAFANDNPSGNQEWERFRVATGAFDAAEMDHATDTIPAGTYEVRIDGVDMQNLNALLMPGRVLCATEEGSACAPLRAFLVGDTVYRDLNGDGNQDPGEPGIAGVTLELVDAFGNVLTSTVTDGSGTYLFEVDRGTYTVRVAAENSAPGGPLAGLTSTTGDSLTDTVIDSNRLHYDFGYTCSGHDAPGTGTIGYWKNHPEAWPVDEISLGGVTYTQAEALAILHTSGRGDKTWDLAKQLIAAKLNVLVGNEAGCVADTIAEADAWLAAHPPGSGVSGRSYAWRHGGSALHRTLDDYNNGRLCAPHRG